MNRQTRQKFQQQPDVFIDDGIGEAYVLTTRDEINDLRSAAGVRPFGKLEGGYVAMFQSLQIAMAIDDNLTGDDRRVFQFLTGIVDDMNWMRVVQKDVAARLGMQPPHVNRAIKNLVGAGYILEGPPAGNCKTYRLNPHMGWKGPALKHKPAKNAAPVPTGKVVDINKRRREKQLSLL